MPVPRESRPQTFSSLWNSDQAGRRWSPLLAETCRLRNSLTLAITAHQHRCLLEGDKGSKQSERPPTRGEEGWTVETRAG